MANKRIFYAVEQINLKPYGSGSFDSTNVVHGVQSLGINTSFNNDQVFELSQISIYENIENLPDVELTMEKVIDGYALIYHLATPTATSPTLAGRSVARCDALLSVYEDTLDATSGNPISETAMSGMYLSQMTYTLPVEGNCTESVTLVGNNKVVRTTGFETTGSFASNDDAPQATSGVQRRENVLFGHPTGGGSVLPKTIDGITSLGTGSGYNAYVSGEFGAHIQNITISTNLGRENINELGRKGPYFRYATFPVEVTCEISVITTRGDMVTAREDQDNLVDEQIDIFLDEGTEFNLGTRNQLQRVSHTGGNAGTGGGNVTVTYSYRNFNTLTVTNPEDPAGL